jgi:hypothetical protein
MSIAFLLANLHFKLQRCFVKRDENVLSMNFIVIIPNMSMKALHYAITPVPQSIIAFLVDIISFLLAQTKTKSILQTHNFPHEKLRSVQ